MSLGNPLGLLGLLAVAGILAIHLFRRRYKPRPVAGLFLYGPVPPTQASGRRRQRIVWRASLWLELLAALTATWYLADPYFSDQERARHVVVVLDDRARLQARLDGERTAREVLGEALRERLDALERGDRVTLVASGSPARILAGPAVRPDAAIAALPRWTARAGWHPLDEALQLAADLARKTDVGGGGEVLLVSDAEPAGLAEGVGLVTRGRPRPTVGITDVRWWRASDDRPERIVARVLAQGGTPRQASVLVESGGKEVARTAVQLAPGRPSGVVLLIPAGLESATVRLAGPHDATPFDDAVEAHRPPDRSVAVLSETATPAVERALGVIDGVTRTQEPLEADLIVGIGGELLPASDGWRLDVVAHPDGPTVVGPFLTARGHALLEGLDLTGVVWAGAAREAAPEEEVLLSAGDAVLVTQREQGRRRHFTVHVDLAGSTLPQHPAWPSLLANAVAARRAALPGPQRVDLPLGQPLEIALPPGERHVTLRGPEDAGGRLTADARGRVLIPALDVPGAYRLTLDGRVEPWATVWAQRLDARLGDLSGTGDRDVEPGAGAETGVSRERGALAHLLPLVLLCLAALGAWVAWRREEGTA